jgi:hypothetical protein
MLFLKVYLIKFNDFIQNKIWSVACYGNKVNNVSLGIQYGN